MAKDRNEPIPNEEAEENSSKRDGQKKPKRKKREESSSSSSSSSEESSTGSEDERPRSSRKRKRRRSSRRRRSTSSDSESDTDSESDAGESESEGEEEEEKKRRRSRSREKEERRRRREKRRKREKEERRRRRKKKKEKEKERKSRKKKKEKDGGKKGAVTNSWGKYGIIRETDMWNKRPEFTAWLAEVKQVNLETLPNWEEKQMFKEFMEDHNTATFPSKKYYDLDAYHRHKMEKELKKGLKKVSNTERTIFNDEEQRRIELQRERERHKEEQVEALKRSMQGGMAQAMKEQARLKEEMAYQYRLGNFEPRRLSREDWILMLQCELCALEFAAAC